jgi:hypothetical protein
MMALSRKIARLAAETGTKPVAAILIAQLPRALSVCEKAVASTPV